MTLTAQLKSNLQEEDTSKAKYNQLFKITDKKK